MPTTVVAITPTSPDPTDVCIKILQMASRPEVRSQGSEVQDPPGDPVSAVVLLRTSDDDGDGVHEFSIRAVAADDPIASMEVGDEI